jgi:hypothetical protein
MAFIIIIIIIIVNSVLCYECTGTTAIRPTTDRAQEPYIRRKQQMKTEI